LFLDIIQSDGDGDDDDDDDEGKRDASQDSTSGICVTLLLAVIHKQKVSVTLWLPGFARPGKTRENPGI